MVLYGLLPVLGFTAVAIQYGLTYAVWTPAGFIGLMWLHGIITWAGLRLSEDRKNRNWKLLIRFPWLGLLPDQPVPLSVLRRLLTEHLCIGAACIYCAYPWITFVSIMQLTFLHIWILAPTFWMLFRFRTASRYGLLKINPKETSYYAE
jgi:hypothetical protein